MEKYLDQCLTSLIIDDEKLMMQLEVFVIIDGAKDRSSEIAHTYQKKYPYTFVVIDKDNGNYGSCINCGLKEATGKYVKILDADDSFHNRNFQIFLKRLEVIDADVVFTDFVYKNEADVNLRKIERELPPDIILSLHDVVGNLNRHLVAMHELTYKRSIFNGLNYHQTEGISYTDLEWCFLPMSQIRSVCYLNLVVYRYLIGREGQSVSQDVAKRAIAQRILSAKIMVNQFAGVSDLHYANRVYLEKRLVWCVETIYYCFLVSFPDLGRELLVDFDKFIKQHCIFLYNELNESVIHDLLRFRYINEWRKCGYKQKWLSSLICLLLRLYSKLRKTCIEKK